MENSARPKSRRRLAALTASIGIAVSLTLAGCGGGSSAVENVDAPSFSQVIAEPGVVTVDVRTPQEFAEGHIAGSINIDAEAVDFETQLGTLDKSTHYAIYCRSGNRSGVAAAKMADMGFTNVTNLDGGVIDWAAAGGQLVVE